MPSVCWIWVNKIASWILGVGLATRSCRFNAFACEHEKRHKWICSLWFLCYLLGYCSLFIIGFEFLNQAATKTPVRKCYGIEILAEVAEQARANLRSAGIDDSRAQVSLYDVLSLSVWHYTSHWVYYLTWTDTSDVPIHSCIFLFRSWMQMCDRGKFHRPLPLSIYSWANGVRSCFFSDFRHTLLRMALKPLKQSSNIQTPIF